MVLTFELRSVRGINRILRHVVTCLSCNIRKYVVNMTDVRHIQRNTLLVAPRVWDQYSSRLYRGIDKMLRRLTFQFRRGVHRLLIVTLETASHHLFLAAFKIFGHM